MADSDPIKSRIEQVLALRGWSARELSQRSNLSENHVAQILSRGARRVGHETLSKIAAGGGVRVTWLTSGEEPMEAAGVSPNAAPAEESDPCMGNRPGFEAALVGARALRAPGVILVGLMKSDERRCVVGTHECCHHLARESKQFHHHADVWAMTLATIAPRRRLLELRGTVESPGDLAAACGIPWWAAELRLENPLARRWLGGYERKSAQLY